MLLAWAIENSTRKGRSCVPHCDGTRQGQHTAEIQALAVIPLFRHMPVSPLHYEYPIEHGVLFTIRLDSMTIKERWIPSPGEMTRALAVLPNDWSSRSNDPGTSTGIPPVLQFYLPTSVLDDFTDAHGLARTAPSEDVPPFVCSTLARLTKLLTPGLYSSKGISTLFMDQFVLLFCAYVVHHRSLTRPDPLIHRGGLSTGQRRRAVEVLSRGPYDNITLAVIAQECGISVSHFSRAFKISFGLPVHRWIVTQRVEQAKHLLLKSDEALLEIAAITGFPDQASFNRTFAKATGLSPGRWRKFFKE